MTMQLPQQPVAQVQMPTLAIVAWMTSEIFAIAIAIGGAWWLDPPDSHWRPLILLAIGLILYLVMIFLILRLLISRLQRMPDGPVPRSGSLKILYEWYRLLACYHQWPLLVSNVLPVPVRTLVARWSGMRLGKGTLMGGRAMDVHWISCGRNCVIGLDALFSGHLLQPDGEHVARIVIGDNVLIGACAKILPGVHIGNGAVVTIGSMVRGGTTIPPGETWGGVPARRLKSAE